LLQLSGLVLALQHLCLGAFLCSDRLCSSMLLLGVILFISS
jgi:hypothetical protein